MKTENSLKLAFEKLELYRKINSWEIKVDDRKIQEKLFRNYTGSIDVCELHIPYTHYEYMRDMFIERSKDKTKQKMLFLCGDSLNLDTFGPFYEKGGDRSKPSDELAEFIKMLKYAKKIYTHIVFLLTNHEKRMQKVITRAFKDKALADEVIKRMETFEDLFRKKGINDIIIVDDVLFQVGDVLFCHFENNSSVPGKICRDIIQYLIPRVEKNWNVVFEAHTHAQSKIPIDGKLCIECGTLSETMDYWRSGKLNGRGKCSSIGNGVCVMRNGEAIINECNFVMRGWEGKY